MVIIQLVVPSALGTNAGHSVYRSEPAQQNLRASACARKVFSWDRSFSRLKPRPHPLLRCAAHERDTRIGENKLRKEAAQQHRFGDAADREHVGGGA
jgi:hypothetical protein